jgi:hypothetical protein
MKLILASAIIMSFAGVTYAADPPDWYLLNPSE